MSTLDDWLGEAAAALGLPADAITVELRDGLLDLTRDVAHGITRIAGPLTTYLVGAAVGAGMPAAEAVHALTNLAAAREAGSADAEGSEGADAESAGG